MIAQGLPINSPLTISSVNGADHLMREAYLSKVKGAERVLPFQ
jgi:hypothetical protein